MAKEKNLILIGLIALSSFGCKGNLMHRGEDVQKDLASALSTDSLFIDSDRQKNLSEAIAQRVTAMFNDVYRHYAIADSLIRIEKSPLENKKTGNWEKTCYYSESLKALWDKMPDDDIVIDYDPWTMSQDYDTLVCQNVEVLSLSNDSLTSKVIARCL